nr:1,6-anhydro-N-acetylmuramyl-L-alanine amidase AmpD [Kushneria sinocarnis]
MEGHRLRGARQVPSPNCNERPRGEVSLVVVHAISLPPGVFRGDAIEQLFTNRLAAHGHPFFAAIAGLRVSAHLLIRRDGECIQFVPFDRRAWHAGRSCWQGRSQVNDFSIGIELEGDARPFAAAQYHRLGGVLQALVRSYPGLSLDRVAGHEQIAPLRKEDPGPGFDWQYLKRCLHPVPP